MTILPDPTENLPDTSPPVLDEEQEDFVNQLGAALERDPDKKLSPTEQPVESTTTEAPVDDSSDNEDSGGEEPVAQQEPPPTEIAEEVGEDGEHPSPEPPTPQSADLNAVAQRFFGRTPTEEEIVQLLMFQRELSSLPPEKLQQIQQVVTGQAPPTFTGATPVPTTTPTAPATPVEFNIPEYLDPAVAESLKPLVSGYQSLEAKLQAIEAQQVQQAYERQQREQQQMVADINAEIDAWRKEKNLSPDDYIILETQVRQSGLLPSVIAGGVDPRQAARQLFETTYYSNPDFMEREIQRRVAEERKAQSKQMQRTNKSTALAGGGGNKPPATPAKPVDSKSRDAEIAEFLAQVMEAQQ